MLGFAVATAGPVEMWWRSVLLVGAGAAAMGVLHWVRIRRLRRRATARIDALRTEKEEAEEALGVAANRAERLEEQRVERSTLLEGMSRSLRRALALTLGPVDTVLERRVSSLSEEARTQLRLTEQNGLRLRWLVNQMSDVAELERGSVVFSPTEADLPGFVTQGVQSYERLAERRGVTLAFESTLDDPSVWFDPSKMEALLANLLFSAFHAVEEGGTVRVGLHPACLPEESKETTGAGEPTADIELRVEHTGSEIPLGLGGDAVSEPSEEILSESDGRVSASVGLRLADDLADLHAGRLQARCPDGDIVRYAVRLPRQPEEAPDADREAADDSEEGDTSPDFLSEGRCRGALTLSRNALLTETTADAPSSSSESNGVLPGNEGLPGRRAHSGDGAGTREDVDDRTTVLVVDNNSVVCTLVRTQLEPKYRVEEAHDGAEGYAQVRRLQPDLVITDVMMPEINGFELCRKIKGAPDIDHVPVVFLTARTGLEDKVEGFDMGADAYLTKPFRPEELIARVEDLIATRRAFQEAFRVNGGS